MTDENGNDPFRDYKKKMIDPVSNSFCAAKWLNATIWLNSGETTSCHHPPSHRIDPDEIAINPSAIHNTQYKKNVRQMMLKGERPSECSYCWRVEDFERNNISDRVYKTMIYDDQSVKNIATAPWDDNVNLQTLEIAFGRACNFGCSYCNPAFSTTWVKDIKDNGVYTDLDLGGQRHYANTADWADRGGRHEEDNPYIQAFWKWWESDLKNTLKELRITGGEPLMQPSVWRLFDWFADNTQSNMDFVINSNLVPEKPATMDRLIAASHGVKNFQLYTSNESVGKHSEYIRDGMVYDVWKRNLVRLIEEGNVQRTHCMMTINTLCLASITEFLDEMLELRDIYGEKSPRLSVNIMRYPSFQTIPLMPVDLKQICHEKLATWLDSRKSNSGLYQREIHQIERLIDYLDIVNTPDSDEIFVKTENSFPKEFISFFQQYDRRRGHNFVETFPMFAPWYNESK